MIIRIHKSWKWEYTQKGGVSDVKEEMNKGGSRRPEVILSKESTAMGGRTKELWLRGNRYCLHSRIRLGKQGHWTLLANPWLTGAYWTPTHLFHWILAYGGAHRIMNSHRHWNSVTAPVSAVVEVVAHLSACATGIYITYQTSNEIRVLWL